MSRNLFASKPWGIETYEGEVDMGGYDAIARSTFDSATMPVITVRTDTARAEFIERFWTVRNTPVSNQFTAHSPEEARFMLRGIVVVTIQTDVFRADAPWPLGSSSRQRHRTQVEKR